MQLTPVSQLRWTLVLGLCLAASSFLRLIQWAATSDGHFLHLHITASASAGRTAFRPKVLTVPPQPPQLFDVDGRSPSGSCSPRATTAPATTQVFSDAEFLVRPGDLYLDNVSRGEVRYVPTREHLAQAHNSSLGTEASSRFFWEPAASETRSSPASLHWRRHEFVCVNSSNWLVVAANSSRHDALAPVVASFTGGVSSANLRVSSHTIAFERHTPPLVVTPDAVGHMPFLEGPTYIIDQWADRLQPAHWLQALSMLAARHQLHAPRGGTSSAARFRVIFQRSPFPSIEYIDSLLSIALETLGLTKSSVDILFREDVNRYGGVCLQQAFGSPFWGFYFSREEFYRLRAVAHARIGAPPPWRAAGETPRVGWLVRNEGSALRTALGTEAAKALFPVPVEVFDLNSRMNLAEQGQLIARFAIVITSHSSQLANLYMAYENTTVIELTQLPQAFNLDFKAISDKMGVEHVISTHHLPCFPAGLRDDVRCYTGARDCRGKGYTINLPFAVNMTSLAPEVEAALRRVGLAPRENLPKYGNGPRGGGDGSVNSQGRTFSDMYRTCHGFDPPASLRHLDQVSSSPAVSTSPTKSLPVKASILPRPLTDHGAKLSANNSLPPLIDAGRRAWYATADAGWGYRNTRAAAAGDDEDGVDCEALFAALFAPPPPSPVTGNSVSGVETEAPSLQCDVRYPAFPAYHACILRREMTGNGSGLRVRVGTTTTGLGNQLRIGTGALLLALVLGRPLLVHNTHHAALFRAPELPRVRGQSDAERRLLMGWGGASGDGEKDDGQRGRSYLNVTRTRSHLVTPVSTSTLGDFELRCGSHVEAQWGYDPDHCAMLMRRDVSAALAGRDVTLWGWNDASGQLLLNPRYGLLIRRLFCSASPLRISSLAFSWLHSRPHPELALAAAALGAKLGIPFPRLTSVLHGLPPRVVEQLNRLQASARQIPASPKLGSKHPRCPPHSTLLGVQVRLLQSTDPAAEPAVLECASRAVHIAAARLSGLPGSVSGPSLLRHTILSNSSADEEGSAEPRRTLCIWVTADKPVAWDALQSSLSPLGTVVIHRDARPGHTTEQSSTAASPAAGASSGRVDVPTLLGLPRTPFLASLHMDAVDFYLLGELDGLVKSEVSSFGEYGFMRGGLGVAPLHGLWGDGSGNDGGTVNGNGTSRVIRGGGVFIRHNMPGRAAYARHGCFSPNASDAAYTRLRAAPLLTLQLDPGPTTPKPSLEEAGLALAGRGGNWAPASLGS